MAYIRFLLLYPKNTELIQTAHLIILRSINSVWSNEPKSGSFDYFSVNLISPHFAFIRGQLFTTLYGLVKMIRVMLD